MVNTDIAEQLQYHGQAGATGCLKVSTPGGNYAGIYMLDGEVVYAETGEDFGITALFISMIWEDSVTTWEEGEKPPRLIMREAFDSLLYRFAQLEDAGETDPESIRDRIGDTSRVSEVKLLDLSHYAVSFEVLNSPFKGFFFFLEKPENLIGRLEDCNIILPDASISGHHCKVIQDENRIRVIDLGSTNGTRINGDLVTEATLQVGDEFQVGAVLITMHVKLKRNLDREALQRLDTQATIQKGYAPQATTKLDPKKLRHTTERVKGPITWKNLTSTEDKQESKSLFGGLFKKK